MDTHVDIPTDFGTESYDPKEAKRGRGQIDLVGMERGGLDAVFFIVYVGQGERNAAGYARAMADAFARFAAIRRMTDVQYPDIISLARTAADVRRIRGEGRLAALIGIENGHALGRDLEILRTYHDFGARYLGLLHNGHNDLGDSAVPYPRLKDPPGEHGGLTDFGRAAVGRANDLGIMVDISHASMTTAMDAIRASRAPVIASHSSVKGVYEHPRNLSDEVLTAIRDNGGVAQMVAFDAYLRPVSGERQAAFRALRTEMGTKGFVDFERLSDEKRDAWNARRRGDRRQVAQGVGEGLRRTHRLHRQPHRHRPRGHGVGLQRRRRHHRLGQRPRHPERHHRVGTPGLQRGADRTTVGRQPAEGDGGGGGRGPAPGIGPDPTGADEP